MSDGDDTVKLGLAKLQLRPGDLLIVSVPSEWNGADVAILEAELRCDFSELLPPGTVIMVIRRRHGSLCGIAQSRWVPQHCDRCRRQRKQ